MRYLKIFENFVDDFYKSVKDLDKKYTSERQKLFAAVKSKVDEFMFDLTDDFSNENTHRVNYIDFGPGRDRDGDRMDISIYYFLRCGINEYKHFEELLKNAEKEVFDEFGLTMRIIGYAHWGYGEGETHDINHNFFSKPERIFKYINDYYVPNEFVWSGNGLTAETEEEREKYRYKYLSFEVVFESKIA